MFLIKIIKTIKHRFGLRTYQIEGAFVLTILLTTYFIFSRTWLELIGVFAVYFTFKHASVSSRLEESEASKPKELVTVHCYGRLKYFFYLKEILWFAFFAISGSWSALIGVVVFLAFQPWRKFYNKNK